MLSKTNQSGTIEHRMNEVRVIPTPCDLLQYWNEQGVRFLGLGFEWLELLLPIDTRGDNKE